ncbi:hypothetical protein BBJ28_00019435 [Nothophytophthora sp. Chile5]|nr:hypothetical protein BBJ28_00019435 [Nothophytophthora sp. Chile5]
MVFSRISTVALSLLALPALVAQADSSVCQFDDSDSCAIDGLTASSDDGSVLIYPGGDTRCAFDDYTDSVTTFESNSTYFFQVFPNDNQDKTKLMFFFQGGGACVDAYTCDFALQCQLGASSLITTAAAVNDSGIMNRSIQGNLFNDYNIVYLPYCTGDLFVGNKYLEPYESVYNQALGNKQCLGQNIGMYMNGYNNTKAVMEWALENYPDPEHIIIGGFSAGSLGAQMWSAYVANAWQTEEKSTKYQVLADSYAGVFPEYKVAAGELINYYGGCDSVEFPDDIVTECEAQTATVIEMIGSLMEEAPSAEWLFIDSIADHTQRKFYELVLLGIAGYPFTTLMPADEFYGNMTEILDAYALINNVTRFNVDSDQHIWLTETEYQSVVDVDGDVLGDVLTAWLADTTATVAPTATPEATTEAPTATPEATTSAPTSAPTPVATTAAPTTTPKPTTAAPTTTPKPTTPKPTTKTPTPTTKTPTPTTKAPSTPATGLEALKDLLCSILSQLHFSAPLC